MDRTQLFWSGFSLYVLPFVSSAFFSKPTCHCLNDINLAIECSQFFKNNHCFSLTLAHEEARCAANTFTPLFPEWWHDLLLGLLPPVVTYCVKKVIWVEYRPQVKSVLDFFVSFSFLLFVTSFTHGPSELCPHTKQTIFILVMFSCGLLAWTLVVSSIEELRDKICLSMKLIVCILVCVYIGVSDEKKPTPLCSSFLEDWCCHGVSCY